MLCIFLSITCDCILLRFSLHSDYVKPIQLSSLEVPLNEELTMIGWGLIRGRLHPEVLMEAKTRTISVVEAQKFSDAQETPYHLDTRELYVRASGNTSICGVRYLEFLLIESVIYHNANG